MKNVRCIGFDNLADTLHELQGTSERVSFISGGTDFTTAKNRPNPECIVDLSKVRDLQYIIAENDLIRIGAGTTFAAIASHPAIRTKVSALAQAADQIGSVQIRNRATIGGNIASASPAGDSLPVLAVFDAHIITVGPEGTRTLLAKETVAGVCQLLLREKEIIKEIVVPVNGRWLSAFRKIGHRTAVTIARLNMAMLVDYCHQDDTISAGKVALGALGTVPVCPLSVNDFLRDRKVDRAFAGNLAGLLSEVVNTVIPDRESRPYKAEAVKGLAFDIATDLFGARFDLQG
jgi:xanthine dehydrogenase FAD-binding subunit